MADLTLSAALIEQLEETARRENRSVESLIASLLSERTHSLPPQLSQANAVEVERREAILKADRLRMYARARTYWAKENNPRQHMTDDELEEQFWLFDQNGIPRLKSEQGTINVPESPLQSILDSVSNNPEVWSFGKANLTPERMREIMKTEFVDHLLARMNRPAVPRDE
ncbi:MAG: hypothetical protein KF716_10630 [Anaerolineae bacterium]|nr:hypothetical protein [Anaerolineae bacterium]